MNLFGLSLALSSDPFLHGFEMSGAIVLKVEVPSVSSGGQPSRVLVQGGGLCELDLLLYPTRSDY